MRPLSGLSMALACALAACVGAVASCSAIPEFQRGDAAGACVESEGGVVAPAHLGAPPEQCAFSTSANQADYRFRASTAGTANYWSVPRTSTRFRLVGWKGLAADDQFLYFADEASIRAVRLAYFRSPDRVPATVYTVARLDPKLGAYYTDLVGMDRGVCALTSEPLPSVVCFAPSTDCTAWELQTVAGVGSEAGRPALGRDLLLRSGNGIFWRENYTADNAQVAQRVVRATRRGLDAFGARATFERNADRNASITAISDIVALGNEAVFVATTYSEGTSVASVWEASAPGPVNPRASSLMNPWAGAVRGLFGGSPGTDSATAVFTLANDENVTGPQNRLQRVRNISVNAAGTLAWVPDNADPTHHDIFLGWHGTYAGQSQADRAIVLEGHDGNNSNDYDYDSTGNVTAQLGSLRLFRQGTSDKPFRETNPVLPEKVGKYVLESQTVSPTAKFDGALTTVVWGTTYEIYVLESGLGAKMCTGRALLSRIVIP